MASTKATDRQSSIAISSSRVRFGRTHLRHQHSDKQDHVQRPALSLPSLAVIVHGKQLPPPKSSLKAFLKLASNGLHKKT
jgi:hypothetical protein